MKQEKKLSLMRARHGGFTLVEIMVVVVIIGLLAALVGPRIFGQSQQARVTTTKTQIAQFDTILGLYQLNNGVYPTTDQGLEALVKKPTIPPIPNNYQDGGYMKEVPNDSWGRPYIYKCPGEHNSEYDIYSLGPDGQDGTDDDITNWTKSN